MKKSASVRAIVRLCISKYPVVRFRSHGMMLLRLYILITFNKKNTT